VRQGPVLFAETLPIVCLTVVLKLPVTVFISLNEARIFIDSDRYDPVFFTVFGQEIKQTGGV